MRLVSVAAPAILLIAATAGCSSDRHGAAGSMPFGNHGNPVAPAPSDTVPVPVAPQPPVIQPAVFLSYADSTAAGATADTRWLLGNDGEAPFTLHWTLSSDDGWAGLPLEGSVDLAPLSASQVTIPVPVPAAAAPGMHGLTIVVTRPGGLEYTTEGVVRVHS